MQTVGSSCCRGKMNLEKTEMLICSGAINSAGVVFAEILMKLRGGGEQGSGGQNDSAGGGLLGLLFCILYQNLEQCSSPPSSGRLFLMLISLHGCLGMFLFQSS